MRAFLSICRRLNGWLNGVAGIVLICIMLLTVADVIMRALRMPIIGTYELVAISAAMIVGFALPQTSWEQGHVNVDILVKGRSPAVKKCLFVYTRMLGIALFALLCFDLYRKGIYLYKTREVSQTLRIPFYPVPLGLAFCMLLECLTLVADILKSFRVEKNG